MLPAHFYDLVSKIKSLDQVSGEIGEYNANKGSSHKFRLHDDLDPCPFEGDILYAPVVLLFANPCSNNLVRGDHEPDPGLMREWPLWGLHPNAKPALNAWWSKRLKEIIGLSGDAQKVAKSVAAIQLNGWASSKFDAEKRLPSRQLMLETAEAAARRGALLVVMRSKRLWFESEIIRSYGRKIIAKNPLCSYVSKGNLGDPAWEILIRAIMANNPVATKNCAATTRSPS